MTRRAPLTPAEIQGIIHDHTNGHRVARIARDYNISRSTVEHHIRTRINIALTGGQWTINRRTRVLEYVLDCDQEAS